MLVLVLFCLLWDNNGDIMVAGVCCVVVSVMCRMYHSRRYQVVMEKMIVIEIKIVMDQ